MTDIRETNEIGKLAAALMDRIEADHPGVEIGEIVIAVEVIESSDRSAVAVRWTDRPLSALALLHGAIHTITRRNLQ